MKKQVFRVDSDRYNGAWYPASSGGNRGMIPMLGDSSEDRMARTGGKWMNQQGNHVMAISPEKKDYGHHGYPLERFGKAIEFMKAQGCEKLGGVGAWIDNHILFKRATSGDCHTTDRKAMPVCSSAWSSRA